MSEDNHMRKMLLSFSANVFDSVLSGEKIYEHRNVFPDGKIEAYLYVGAPLKCICGVMHLDNRTNMTEWLEKYQYDKEAVCRIQRYLEKQKYAMEIIDFQMTNKIPLEQLRKDLSRFVVPQMYYYLENTELEEYLDNNLHAEGDIIIHDFSHIESWQICVK